MWNSSCSSWVDQGMQLSHQNPEIFPTQPSNMAASSETSTYAARTQSQHTAVPAKGSPPPSFPASKHSPSLSNLHSVAADIKDTLSQQLLWTSTMTYKP